MKFPASGWYQAKSISTYLKYLHVQYHEKQLKSVCTKKKFLSTKLKNEGGGGYPQTRGLINHEVSPDVKLIVFDIK